MKTFRWKVKPGMDVASTPSVREVRFGDGYSQRAPAGLNANLKTYSVTLSVPRWEAHGAGIVSGRARRLESLSVDAAYDWRQIKVICAKWTSRVSMLRVEVSEEFK
ncbi:phage tail protein [Escherichia coli]|uniref:phage tail protein n=1 Tax=Escherichia coli TaxID=562 RepID=UPI0038712632